jgi:hypothetical protein
MIVRDSIIIFRVDHRKAVFLSIGFISSHIFSDSVPAQPLVFYEALQVVEQPWKP